MTNTNKDVGILTFHRTHNFGAFLQTFALYNITSKLGYVPYVINYQDRNQWLSESYPVIRKFRRPIRLLDFIQKNIAFNKSLKQLNMTPYTRSKEDLYNISFPKVIVGSDIVWNYHLNACDSPFFGNFDAQQRIAYAPSFGWASIDDPPPPELKNKLTKFNSISVRDINSQKIVNKVSGITPPIVLDPTLLWDFSGTEKQPQTPAIKKPFLLVYAFDLSDSMIVEIKSFAAKHKLKIIGVGYRLKGHLFDYTLMGLTPFEWLWIIKHASFIYTNTFHGSIFSIKYKKAFAVKMGYSVSPKLEPLLERIGLLHRVIKQENELDTILTTNIDFTESNNILDRDIASSFHWLKGALETQ